MDAEYSVWLVPEGEDRAELAQSIKELSSKHNTLAFDPHVTLIGLGRIPGVTVADLESRIAKIAGLLNPFPLHLREIVSFDFYFRSIVMTVDPSPEVMKAGELGRRLYGEIHGKKPDEAKFFPHLSLLYSDLSTKRTKEIVASELNGLKNRLSFEASRIELWDTRTRDTRLWRRLKDFPFGSSSNPQKKAKISNDFAKRK